eukprot:PhF_6_TR5256/c0_g1_i1/m.7633
MAATLPSFTERLDKFFEKQKNPPPPQEADVLKKMRQGKDHKVVNLQRIEKLAAPQKAKPIPDLPKDVTFEPEINTSVEAVSKVMKYIHGDGNSSDSSSNTPPRMPEEDPLPLQLDDIKELRMASYSPPEGRGSSMSPTSSGPRQLPPPAPIPQQSQQIVRTDSGMKKVLLEVVDDDSEHGGNSPPPPKPLATAKPPLPPPPAATKGPLPPPQPQPQPSPNSSLNDTVNQFHDVPEDDDLAPNQPIVGGGSDPSKEKQKEAQPSPPIVETPQPIEPPLPAPTATPQSIVLPQAREVFKREAKQDVAELKKTVKMMRDLVQSSKK